MSFFSDIQNIFEETFKPIYESQQPCINYIEMSKVYYSLFFGLMKVIDCAQSFSKTQCVEEFEKNGLNDENILKKAVFPDGEELGFTNFSKFDLNALTKDEENFMDNLQEYVLKFDNNSIKIFNSLNCNDNLLTFLATHELLFNCLEKVNEIELNPTCYDTHEHLVETYEQFIKEHQLYFKINTITTNDGKTYENPMNNLLTKYLLNNTDLTNKNKIKVYDPSCMDGNVLFKVKEEINKLNPNCEVELYGKEFIPLAYGICASRMLIQKENLSNLINLDDYENQFDINDFDTRFDFIVSNFLITSENIYHHTPDCDIYEKIDDYFLNKLNENGKLVLPVFPGVSQQILDNISKFKDNDYLEALISVASLIDEYIMFVILNKNKPHKNKVLLIDEIREHNTTQTFLSSYDEALEIFYDEVEIYKNFDEKINSEIVDSSDLKEGRLFLKLLNKD